MRLSTCAQDLLEQTMRFGSQGQVRDRGHYQATQEKSTYYYNSNFNNHYTNNNANHVNRSNSDVNHFQANNDAIYKDDLETSNINNELLEELFCLEMSSQEDKLPWTSRVRPSSSSSSMSPPYMSRPTRLCSTDSIRSSTSGGSTLQDTLAEFQELQQRQQQQHAASLEEQDTEAVMAELRSSMGPAVISLAFQEARREIEAVSTLLEISSDPSRWSRSDFFAWLRSTLRQQECPSAVVCEENLVAYCFDASTLTKQDFHLILPLQTAVADVMFAKLEIWRNAFHQDLLSTVNNTTATTNIDCGAMTTSPATAMNITTTSSSLMPVNTCSMMNTSTMNMSTMNPTNTCAMSPTPIYATSKSAFKTSTMSAVNTCTMNPPTTILRTTSSMSPIKGSTMNTSTMNTSTMSKTSAMMSPSAMTCSSSPCKSTRPPPIAITATTTGGDERSSSMEFDSELSLLMEDAWASSLANSTEDSEETLTTCSSTPSTPTTPTSPSTSSGRPSSVHLWQFVKELLKQPEQYSDIIRWLDRDAGIFKIVDSQKVAHLWGRRKNRPAMNYDKLSRSLRQYYKKGIMKKTERTQRLVYQFCPPYHL